MSSLKRGSTRPHANCRAVPPSWPGCYWTLGRLCEIPGGQPPVPDGARGRKLLPSETTGVVLRDVVDSVDQWSIRSPTAFAIPDVETPSCRAVSARESPRRVTRSTARRARTAAIRRRPLPIRWARNIALSPRPVTIWSRSIPRRMAWCNVPTEGSGRRAEGRPAEGHEAYGDPSPRKISPSRDIFHNLPTCPLIDTFIEALLKGL